MKWNEMKRCSKYAIAISINEIRDANVNSALSFIKLPWKLHEKEREKKKVAIVYMENIQL